MKIYLAASLSKEYRENMYKALNILRDRGFDVYAPIEHFIPNAWDYPNHEWGLMVFENDVNAIQECDVIVALSYGRLETSAGTNWEIGYAYGIGKKVILVEMNVEIQSLMVANGRYATIKGLDELKTYDFEKMPKTRTKTEQK